MPWVFSTFLTKQIQEPAHTAGTGGSGLQPKQPSISPRVMMEILLDPGNLNHPLEVWGEDSVLDEPPGELGPLVGVAAIDGQTGLSVLVFSVLQVTGYFLVHIFVDLRFTSVLQSFSRKACRICGAGVPKSRQGGPGFLGTLPYLLLVCL